MSKGVLSKCILLSLIAIFSEAVVAGNGVSKAFCRAIEKSVVRKLDGAKIRTNLVFDNECWFEFTVGNKNPVEVSLTVERYDKESESIRSVGLTFAVMLISEGLERKEQLHFDDLDGKKDWDEAYFMKAKGMNSGTLILRTRELDIQMVSKDDNLLLEMKRLLSSKLRVLQGRR